MSLGVEVGLDPGHSVSDVPEQSVRKVGELLCLFPWGQLHGSPLTRRRLGRGLPPYQVVSRSTQPFGYNHGPKSGAAMCGVHFGMWSWVHI